MENSEWIHLFLYPAIYSVKPSLKKVSKYDNKFKKAAASVDKGEKQDFRGQLKVVKKDVMEEIMNTVSNIS